MYKFIETAKKYTPALVSQVKKVWSSDYIYLEICGNKMHNLGKIGIEVFYCWKY